MRVVTVAGDPEREARLVGQLELSRDAELVLRCMDRVEVLGAIRGGTLDAVVIVGDPVLHTATAPVTETPAELDAAERQRELELLRADHERLDELQQRQLRYASYAWQPPAQGGDIRAEDGDPPSS